MTTTIDYALMAGHAYRTTRDGINWFPVPQGWIPFFPVPDLTTAAAFPATSGFEAVSFQRGTEIVISFAGTDQSDIGGDIAADLALAAGILSDQLCQAADYYLAVKAAAPAGTTITFTGHSLGGGLASLMAVMFGEPAVTFDQAPFLKSAQTFVDTDLEGNQISRSVAQGLRTYLTGRWPESMLNKLDGYIAANDPLGSSSNTADTLAVRSGLVSNINVDGEFLTSWFLVPTSNRIGSQSNIFNSNAGVGGIDLHSQALLTAFLQSEQTAPAVAGQKQSLSEATFKLTELLKMIFDPSLFAYPTDNSNETNSNFLELIVNHEAGHDPRTNASIAPDAMVTRLTADLWKLAQDGGLTLNESIGAPGATATYYNWNNVSKALTAFAMQKYYEEQAGRIGQGQELFDTAGMTGGIHFDTAAVVGESASITGAKGYQYFQDYLNNTSLLSAAERSLIQAMLPTLRDWYVQAGVSGMNATDTLNRGAFMLGGTGDDNMTGGTGSDLLVGNAGSDTLTGGIGADILMGGSGYDTYYADASDTIKDSDGSGKVMLNGAQLSFATRNAGESLWTDTSGNTYALSGGRLTVNDSLVIEDFHNRELGIYLDNAENPNDPNNPNQNPRPPGYNPGNAGMTRRIDPLVLDLNENGQIDAVASTSSTAYFDFNGDGISERSGWIAPQDGFLALDANGNGVIDGLSELFGTAQIDGFTELGQHDSNGDGRIDAQDADFAKLRVWQDLNQDGVSQAGELKSLDAAGISRINLGTTVANIAIGDNLVVATGSYTRHTGKKLLAADIQLGVNFALTDSNPNRPLDLPPTLAADLYDLPWLRGYGNVKSLPVAYGEDLALQQAAGALAARSWTEILTGFDGFMRQWTGLDQAHAAHGVTRSYLSTEDKVWMLENLTGQSANRTAIEAAHFGAISPAPGQFWNTPYIDNEWATFVRREAMNFAIQTASAEWLQGVSYSLNLDRLVVIDAPAFQQSLTDHLKSVSDPDAAAFAAIVLNWLPREGVAIDLAALRQNLVGTTNETLFNDVLASNPERLFGQQSNGGFAIATANGIFTAGMDGNDYLTGTNASEVMIGGQGNDTLVGNGGNDIYYFARGFGQDAIWNNGWGGSPTLRFDVGIASTDVGVARSGDTLLLSLSGSNDRVSIYGYFTDDGTSSNRIAAIEFADGTRWDFAKVKTFFSATGTSGNDQMWGYNTADTLDGADGDDLIEARAGNDTVNGGAGNDRLFGQDGADILDGGLGNDTLDGGNGNDIYKFGPGFGQDIVLSYEYNVSKRDVIEFSTEITSGSIAVQRQDLDLILKLKGSTDKVTIQNYFWNEDAFRAYGVEAIRFADGTNWDYATITAKLALSTEDDDWLFGTSGADVLDALGGNDYINGRGGDDAVFGSAGNDTIHDDAGNDTLDGGAGDDVITDTGAGNNTLRGGAGNDTITYGQSSNIVEGGDGNDRIQVNYQYAANYGQANTLRGGQGNDQLVSGNSTDTYLYNRGDGQDTINDYDYNFYNRTDKIVFGAGIVQADLFLSRSGNNLVVKINDPANAGASDQITVENWFTSSQYQIENFQFVDGSSLNASQLSVLGNKIYGTGGADTISGFWDDSTIYGLDGDDTITDYGGTNTIYGGAGNDSITYGQNSNTIEGGDGNDRIQVNYQSGYNYKQSNTLYGGRGNDRLVSGNSTDTYLYNRGDGSDVINDYDNYSYGKTDKIVFGAGIEQSDLSVSRSGNNLVVKINDTGNAAATDQITVESWYVASQYQIEVFLFADGSSLNATQLSVMGNIVYGTGGGDTINGFSDNNTIYGLDGDDAITDTGGTNAIYGGAGNDTITYGQSSNTIEGGDGNDLIKVNSQTGGNYNQSNTLKGGAGADRIQSGNSADTYLYNRGDGSDVINDYDHNIYNRTDKIVFGAGIVQSDLTVSRSGNNLVVRINDPSNAAATDQITVERWYDGVYQQIELLQFADGSSLNANQLSVMGYSAYVVPNSAITYVTLNGTSNADTINGFGDNNTIYGLDGDDVITDTGGTNIVYAGDGTDTVTFGYASNNTIEGGAGDDLIKVDSYASSNHLYAQTITGGLGNDRIQSGGSADTYLFNRGDGSDTISDNDNYGYGKTDKIVFGAGIAQGDLAVSRSGNNLVVRINDPSNAAATDLITVESWYAASQYQIEVFQFVDGSSLNASQLSVMGNKVYGTVGADTINGFSNDNTIYGLDGDDVITDTGGTNIIYAGEGNDTVTFVDASNNTIEGGAGDDLIKVDAYTWQHLYAQTFAGGLGNDRIQSGSSADTYLYNRGDGSDTIYDYDVTGYGKTDRVVFGSGIVQGDLIMNRSGNNLVVKINDPANAGATDQITVENWYGSSQYQIESFQFADGSSLNASQLSVLGNKIYGTGGADTINGFSDNNTIYGLDGDDTIIDIAGNNIIYGGTGNDTITFGAGTSNTIEGGDGNDLIQVNYQYGGSYNQSNTLYGGKGNDQLVSGNSADIYLYNRGDGSDTISDIDVDNRTDRVLFGAGIVQSDLMLSRVGMNLVVKINNPQNVSATDQITIDGWFYAPQYQIELFQFADGSSINSSQMSAMGNKIYGTGSADTITGYSDDNYIYGLAGADNITDSLGGNDFIDGGAGADVMSGGYGDDTYVVDSNNDVVFEQYGRGTDTVRSSITYTLGYEVENLVLTGTRNIDGTGNNLNNVLMGNDAANILTGGDGSDTLDGGVGKDKLVGGLGDDTYIVDSTDTVVEGVNEGVDTIKSGVSFVLGNNLENLTLTGTSTINGTGNSLDNVLIGNSSANTLTGNSGNDTLDGGAGADILIGGTGNDTYIFGRSYGADLVRETDATTGNTDIARFLSGISTDQIWLRHVGNNLEVSVIGTSDKLTFENWYGGAANHVEQFKTADGKMLLDSKVEALVQAMAAFSPPAAGQTTLLQNYQDALGGVIAANWQ